MLKAQFPDFDNHAIHDFYSKKKCHWEINKDGKCVRVKAAKLMNEDGLLKWHKIHMMDYLMNPQAKVIFVYGRETIDSFVEAYDMEDSTWGVYNGVMIGSELVSNARSFVNEPRERTRRRRLSMKLPCASRVIRTI